MQISTKLAIPTKKDAKRAKSAEGARVKKSADIINAPVDVPVKKDPKKEKKMVKTQRRKLADRLDATAKKSSRKKKSASTSADSADASGTAQVHKNRTSPTTTLDERSNDKKKVSVNRQDKSKRRSKTQKSMKSEKKFNMELAQMFFKQMLESQQTMKSRCEDAAIETMPQSSNVTVSKRSTRTSQRRKKRVPLDRNLFKENGEPVWVVPDRKPGELGTNCHGEQVKYPELSDALEEDGLVMEDGKGWFDRMSKYFNGEMDDGKTGDKPPVEERDPFASMEVLEKHNDEFFSKDNVQYNTAEGIFTLYGNAMERFISNAAEQDLPVRRRAEPVKKDSKEDTSKTCYSSIRFSVDETMCIRYDRRQPITSIQKFRRRYEEKLKMSKTPERRSEASENV